MRCDLKDLPSGPDGPPKSCSNCKERGLKCVYVPFSMLNNYLPRPLYAPSCQRRICRRQDREVAETWSPSSTSRVSITPVISNNEPLPTIGPIYVSYRQSHLWQRQRLGACLTPTYTPSSIRHPKIAAGVLLILVLATFWGATCAYIRAPIPSSHV